ncbi:MAG: endonuclease MutS2 [Candidatus Latescibacter sp.]|nr:endonuclease MutS2 [Candidatus Latescibacter sp.]
MPLPISFDSHALRVVEFDRIREIVSSLADSSAGQSMLAGISPLDDIIQIRRLLDEVDEVIRALRFDDPLPGLSLHDLREVFPLMGIQGHRLEIETIAAIAENLAIARCLKEYFSDRAEKYPIMSGLAAPIVPHEEIEKTIRKVITPDLTVSEDASPELRSIRRKLEQAKASLRSLIEKTLNALSDEVVGERVITLRNGRFVIPIRDAMKNRVPGAVHDRSQTGRTLFIEPLASIEGNNQVRELELAEQEEINRILLELSALISRSAEDIRRNQDIIVRLDVITAKARYGVITEGSIPRISDSVSLNIKKGRHPLLDWKYRKKTDGSRVVPLDMEIGESAVTIVITGPNAGGKTVVLKTVGLLTAMALSGLPVPAGEGTTVFLPFGMYADIGDEQSIEDDLSTFSSHMKQIVTILREAGRGSLVLLDELGGGTNPADGEAIALAVLRRLTSIGAITFASTHHGGLKVFAHETEGVMNASMQFDSEHLRPTFVLRAGIPGSSYAFEIAARMGMPQSVLSDAETLAGGERKSLESLILEMDQRVRQAEDERRKAESERLRMEMEKEKYEIKLREYSEKRQEMLGEAISESKKIMETANRSIESAIRLIKEKNASRDSIAEAKSLVSQAAAEIQKKADQIPRHEEKKKRPPLVELKRGQRVWVDSISAIATVEQVLDGGRRARILAGKSKASLVVNASDLSGFEIELKKTEQTVRVSAPSVEIESTEIDLRGMTFDEAREALDFFLDRLHLSGIETATIIHGKGTGALRSKISPWLDKHPFVDSRRLGNWNEGSYGVTVVTLNK